MTLKDSEQAAPDALPLLARIIEVGGATEAQLVAVRERIQDTSRTSPLGVAKTTVRKIAEAAKSEYIPRRRAHDASEYTGTIEPATLEALGKGTATWMMITPRPGTEQAEGGGTQYPEAVPAEFAYNLALPPNARGQGAFRQVQVTGGGPSVVEVLVVAGSHGGVGALFEQTAPGYPAFSRTYWRDEVVQPLVQANVRARHVVLDACLTASLVDVFAPLCTPDGKVIASMFSVNARFMTPEVWLNIMQEALTDDPKHAIGTAISARAAQFAAQASTFAAEGLVARIRASDANELQTLVASEPSAAPLVSALHFLPRIHDAVTDFLGDPSRRAAAKAAISALADDAAPMEDDEAILIARIWEAMERGQDADVAQFLRARYQQLLGVPDTDLAALGRALRPALTTQAKALPATNAPTHLAVYDAATAQLSYDQLYDDPNAERRIELSTGQASAHEMAQMRSAIRGLATRAVPVAQLPPTPPPATSKPATTSAAPALV